MRVLRVTEAHDYDLVGELIDAPESSYLPVPGIVNPFQILGAPPSSHQRISAIR
jgi:hypothetical protein